MTAPSSGRRGFRRVVVGSDAEGRSTIMSDGAPPRQVSFTQVPEQQYACLWAADHSDQLHDGHDCDVQSLVPGPGGTRFSLTRFATTARLADATTDPVRHDAEHTVQLPGFHGIHDDDGMHATPSVDYGVVIEGRVVLVTETGEVTLRPGDTVVQLGTRHAWRNDFDEPCLMAFVMTGTD